MTLGQQGFKLLPDRLDDVWWECGHGVYAPLHREASDTPRMIEHPVPVYTLIRSLLAEPLSLRFNQEEFCDGLYPYRKTLAFSIFANSGGHFDGRVAFRSAREAAFGPSGRPTAGFRRARQRAQFHQKRRNYPVHPCTGVSLPLS